MMLGMSCPAVDAVCACNNALYAAMFTPERLSELADEALQFRRTAALKIPNSAEAVEAPPRSPAWFKAHARGDGV